MMLMSFILIYVGRLMKNILLCIFLNRKENIHLCISFLLFVFINVISFSDNIYSNITQVHTLRVYKSRIEYEDYPLMGIMQQSDKRLFTLCVWTKGPGSKG